jgi:hypothetical protein
MIQIPEVLVISLTDSLLDFVLKISTSIAWLEEKVSSTQLLRLVDLDISRDASSSNLNLSSSAMT